MFMAEFNLPLKYACKKKKEREIQRDSFREV